jgi:predicted metal-binding membrane protein
MSRDRFILLGGSAVITGIAWLYLARMAGRMHSSAHVHSHVALNVGTLFVMWVVMMVAMMLPSTLPFVFAFSAEQARRRAKQMSVVPPAFFIAGYFGMWTIFSAACAVLQHVLHMQALLSPMMSATSSVFSGVVFIAAGVYQWTPMKNACLRHCRSPLTFLLSDWREGADGAFRMGVDHGMFCIGCCWMLMMLPFAAGVMNLMWMAGITVFLMIEKAASGGQWIAQTSGALLTLFGVYVIIFGISL